MPRKYSSDKNICAIHKEGCLLADDVRNEVCKDLPVMHEHEGKFYCVLHLPDQNKSRNTDFLSVVEERINSKQNDFSHIFVPDNQAFYRKNLSGVVKFNWATFLDEAPFGRAIFEDKIDFIHTIFEQGADFSKAIFKQDVCFNYAEFNGSCSFTNTQFFGKVKFYDSVFNKTVFLRDAIFFQNADFIRTNFSDYVYFDNATFHKQANFNGGIFDKYVYFMNTTFKEGGDYADATFNDKSFFLRTLFNKTTDFGKVRFGENSQVDFHETVFNGEVYFRKAIVEGYMEFAGSLHQPVFNGEKVWLNLEQARIENAKRISFKNVHLRPSWFINVDSRKFVFQDVDWENANGTRRKTEIERKAIESRKITGRPYRLLTIACRELAANAEENNHYEQASRFRRMAMELVFLEKRLSLMKWLIEPFIITKKYFTSRKKYPKTWKARFNSFRKKNEMPYTIWQSIDPTYFLYRTLSFYGESWGRAFLLLFGIIFLSSILYASSFCEFKENKKGLNGWEATFYSLRVMVLQRPDPQPENNFAKGLVAIESIFAPLQVALLALAIRRKFMR